MLKEVWRKRKEMMVERSPWQKDKWMKESIPRGDSFVEERKHWRVEAWDILWRGLKRMLYCHTLWLDSSEIAKKDWKVLSFINYHSSTLFWFVSTVSLFSPLLFSSFSFSLILNHNPHIYSNFNIPFFNSNQLARSTQPNKWVTLILLFSFKQIISSSCFFFLLGGCSCWFYFNFNFSG